MTSEAVWEGELAGFLTELSTVQDELLDVLKRKLGFLAAADLGGLERMNAAEQSLADRLQACYRRRLQMLDRAGREGLPSDSLRSLAEAIPSNSKDALQRRMREAAGRSQLLQHHSLTNWVVVQRTLLHLSQLLEIIATGGRMRPTYGNEEAASSGGSLLDHAA